MSLAEFLRPIPDIELPRLRANIRRGLRVATTLAMLLSVGSPLFLLVHLVIGVPSVPRAVLASCMASGLALLVWIAARIRWSRDRLELVAVGLLLSMLFTAPLQAWADPGPAALLLPLVLALPALAALFFPLRPLVIAGSMIPAVLSIVAARSIAGTPQLLTGDEVFVAVGLAIAASVGAQMRRRMWRDFEITKAEVIAAGRLALLGQLSAGIAHELKTPIAAILNSSAAVQGTVDELVASIGHPQVTDTDLREIIGELERDNQRIASSAERAGRYIQSVRNHAAVQRHRPEPFSVRARVEGVLDLLAHKIRKSRVEIAIDQIEEDAIVYGEAEQFDHILSNLIDNALDACKNIELGALITISTRAGEELVEIVVDDNGPGVPQKLRSSLFQPMVTDKPDGTGLGLAISSEIASSQFGGTLELRGPSRFVLTCRTLTVDDDGHHNSAIRPVVQAAT